MFRVYCVNRYGVKFDKTFDSPYKAKVFMLRCRHGNNVRVIGFESTSQEAYNELAWLID